MRTLPQLAHSVAALKRNCDSNTHTHNNLLQTGFGPQFHPTGCPGPLPEKEDTSCSGDARLPLYTLPRGQAARGCGGGGCCVMLIEQESVGEGANGSLLLELKDAECLWGGWLSWYLIALISCVCDTRCFGVMQDTAV
eukprot:scaffold139119_cov18-Tisochrysis_lutea.AAC.2